ncbi:MAG: hypothetical protein DWQ34_06075 [Planctomycetota bacterium]|nr:MAG: hypothetical protein DWQ34_06075 [Planctomycetota bacterium]REK26538.1 MAG: hypothetical protein DWQ41_09745 [Planctomycetota bacterium]REK33991.1 MAG: hypothetical protein DWQ45_14300 [Planctomycetota bacterium]
MFERRILHHGETPTGPAVDISQRAAAGCWFELLRQGGCGAGQLVLKDRFPDRDEIEIGDWISFEYETSDRWYLGRVEERSAVSPAGVSFRLEGMGIELNEVFPGGFSVDAEGVPPHRFGRTDLFSNDPDYPLETFDSASVAADVVTLLLQRYVTPATHIAHDAGLIESPPDPATVASLKFRGEESVRSIVKELAMVARGSSWGVNAEGVFFFLQQREETALTLREGRDVTLLEESRDREHLFNRVLLTGDYVYDVRNSSGIIARRAYRFRGNFVQPDSRELHGERRIRMWIPWLRTPEDSIAFIREFFRIYSQPTSRYLVETDGRSALLQPWLGRVRLEDRDGNEIVTSHVEAVRVEFDRVPRFRLELGSGDPRTLWPEPPEDERWELPEAQIAGGKLSLTDASSSEDGSSAASSESSGSEGSEASSGSSGVSSAGGTSSAASSSALSSESSEEAGSSLSEDGSSASSETATSSADRSSSAVSSSAPPASSTGGAPSSTGWSSGGPFSSDAGTSWSSSLGESSLS